MKLYLDYVHCRTNATEVRCGVTIGDVTGGGEHGCSSPAVLKAVAALEAACLEELSGEASIGGQLKMAVEKRVEPVPEAAPLTGLPDGKRPGTVVDPEEANTPDTPKFLESVAGEISRRRTDPSDA